MFGSFSSLRVNWLLAKADAEFFSNSPNENNHTYPVLVGQ